LESYGCFKTMPDGFSFFYPDLTPMQSAYTRTRKRSSVETPKYYFVDFEEAFIYLNGVIFGTSAYASDISSAGHMLRRLAKVSEHHRGQADRFHDEMFLVLFYRFRVYGYNLESDV
jgi:hypothetical protein